MAKASKKLPFELLVSAGGYTLSSDRNQIVRLGDELIKVPVDQVESNIGAPIHVIFAELLDQHRIIPLDNGDSLDVGDDSSAPLWARSFPTEADAALSFVSTFGFLGSGEGGMDVRSEPVSYFRDQAKKVSAFYQFGGKPLSKERKDAFNRLAGTHAVSPRIHEGELVVVPKTTLGLIWIRGVGRDVAGAVKWRRCAYCRKPMGLVEGEFRGQLGYFRKDASVCSDICRTRLSRTKGKAK